jgi:hypothetical protein
MVKFITGQSGSGKSTRLAEYIDKLSDEGKKLCIIVPEQFSYEFDKNLYKKLGAVKFNKIFSLTFTGLSRQLFQLYGDNNRKGIYADELSKIVIMEEALLNLSRTPDGINEFRCRKGHPVYYPTLESIKATLDTVHEYGFMGISFDIMRVPLSYLAMYNALFGTSSYTCVRSREGCSRER